MEMAFSHAEHKTVESKGMLSGILSTHAEGSNITFANGFQ
jgi:hypothetical protein